jgi:hypothetical protein
MGSIDHSEKTRDESIVRWIAHGNLHADCGSFLISKNINSICCVGEFDRLGVIRLISGSCLSAV